MITSEWHNSEVGFHWLEDNTTISSADTVKHSNMTKTGDKDKKEKEMMALREYLRSAQRIVKENNLTNDQVNSIFWEETEETYARIPEVADQQANMEDVNSDLSDSAKSNTRQPNDPPLAAACHPPLAHVAGAATAAKPKGGSTVSAADPPPIAPVAGATTAAEPKAGGSMQRWIENNPLSGGSVLSPQSPSILSTGEDSPFFAWVRTKKTVEEGTMHGSHPAAAAAAAEGMQQQQEEEEDTKLPAKKSPRSK